MMFAQYCRIESRAGGVFATDREFIRECLKCIKPGSRYSREFRESRHAWIRGGLQQKIDALRVYFEVMS